MSVNQPLSSLIMVDSFQYYDSYNIRESRSCSNRGPLEEGQGDVDDSTSRPAAVPPLYPPYECYDGLFLPTPPGTAQAFNNYDEFYNLNCCDILINQQQWPLSTNQEASQLSSTPERQPCEADAIPALPTADPAAPALPAARRRRRLQRKDRHSKIQTTRGPRDRRMRLSLDVARRFFTLHDSLGFDKPSKTLEWLLTKSREAIRSTTGGRVASCDSTGKCSGEGSSSQGVLTVAHGRGTDLVDPGKAASICRNEEVKKIRSAVNGANAGCLVPNVSRWEEFNDTVRATPKKWTTEEAQRNHLVTPAFQSLKSSIPASCSAKETVAKLVGTVEFLSSVQEVGAATVTPMERGCGSYNDYIATNVTSSQNKNSRRKSLSPPILVNNDSSSALYYGNNVIIQPDHYFKGFFIPDMYDHL